jgi:hypothetical protein
MSVDDQMDVFKRIETPSKEIEVEINGKVVVVDHHVEMFVQNVKFVIDRNPGTNNLRINVEELL